MNGKLLDAQGWAGVEGLSTVVPIIGSGVFNLKHFSVHDMIIDQTLGKEIQRFQIGLEGSVQYE